MSATPPAHSTPQLDLMRRLRARDVQHEDVGQSFLDAEERLRLNRILNASVRYGVTGTVERRAHDFLVDLGARDEMFRFLTDEERRQIATLTGSVSTAKSSKKKMSLGEFIAIIGVLVSTATAAYLIYDNPETTKSTFWVATWGVICGAGFIGATRRRSGTEDGSVSAPEGLLAVIIWGVAATAVVLLGGNHLSPGVAAFVSFIGAGIIGRAVLKIKDEDDKNWEKWD